MTAPMRVATVVLVYGIGYLVGAAVFARTRREAVTLLAFYAFGAAVTAPIVFR